ncbi:hypothetical protein KEJ51_08200, partial [Candidatus Bathyarchaeota archaeon]|nr:hypothetical protein [Candidatus Bathyarchaeota archaeon]
IVGTMAAWVQNDIKRVLAFSTVGQIGYIFLGLGLGTVLGVAGGIFHFLNHAFFKGLLFLCAGALIHSTGTRKIDEMGGLIERMPLTASAMFVGALSLGGVPPFNGFASKLMIYEASLERGLVAGGPFGGVYVLYCILAMFGSAVSLATLMRVVGSVFFGRLPDHLKSVCEAPATMNMPLLILSAGCIIFGIVPQIAIDYLVRPSVQVVVGGVVGTTSLGLVTSIGFYGATMVAALLFTPIMFGIGIYYLTRPRELPPPLETKYGIFIGGEVEKPYMDIDKIRVDSSLFTFAPAKLFNRFYQFMWLGGIDMLYRRFTGYFVSATEFLRRSHVGVVNIYSVWVVLGAAILIILMVI